MIPRGRAMIMVRAMALPVRISVGPIRSRIISSTWPLVRMDIPMFPCTSCTSHLIYWMITGWSSPSSLLFLAISSAVA